MPLVPMVMRIGISGTSSRVDSRIDAGMDRGMRSHPEAVVAVIGDAAAVVAGRAVVEGRSRGRSGVQLSFDRPALVVVLMLDLPELRGQSGKVGRRVGVVVH